MLPASLMMGGIEFLLERSPRAERAIANGQLRRHGKAAALQVSKQLAP